MYPRKLPNIAIIKRLYWLEEWTIRQIADEYHVSRKSVLKAMDRGGCKRRRPGPITTKDCVVCGDAVCRIRHWYKGKTHWAPTIRCAIHHHLEIRKRERSVYAKKRSGYKPHVSRRVYVRLGRIAEIAPQDWPA